MEFWDRVLKAEQIIRKRVESAFGHGAAQTPLEIRREILDQIESRIVADVNGNVFPFVKIAIQLNPHNEAHRDVFESAFLQDGSLKNDILEKLKDAQAKYPSELDILFDIQKLPDAPPSPDSPLFQLDFVKRDPSRKPEIPNTRFVVLKGTAGNPEYLLKKERILIGRLAEVVDREGRMVRRNDVVFLDTGEDINSTVGRAHARIWFDFERREYCILDEASRYGTRIIRDGRSIDIPSGVSRGVRLFTGDEIYLGQACVRFEFVHQEEAQ